MSQENRVTQKLSCLIATDVSAYAKLEVVAPLGAPPSEVAELARQVYEEMGPEFEIDYSTSRRLRVVATSSTGETTTKSRFRFGEQLIDPDNDRTNLDDFLQFKSELLEMVDSYEKLCEDYGPDTLIDIVYLHGALITDGRICPEPTKSQVLQLVSSLPSGARWAKYIETSGACVHIVEADGAEVVDVDIEAHEKLASAAKIRH